MKRLIGALILALAAEVAACSDKAPSGPDDTSLNAPPGVVVSNAGASYGNVNATSAGGPLRVSSSNVAYVSAAPGTFREALSVSIRNRTADGPLKSLALIDGGFDPVGIAAVAGDELSLALSLAGGGTTQLVVKVPPRRPPGVVRTSPAKGRTGVALNVQVVVVFSEPIDPSSVTPSSIALRNNAGVVSGKLEISADGTIAEFIPSDPLLPATSYTLDLSQALRDQDGDALDATYSIPFTTDAAAASTGSLEIKVSTTTEDGVASPFYTLVVGGQPSSIGPQPSSIGPNETVIREGLSAGKYSVSLGFAAQECFLVSGDTVTMVDTEDHGSGRLGVLVRPGARSRVSFSVACYKLRESTSSVELAVVVGGQIQLATGGKLTPLTSSRTDNEPAWSPDGKRIAFTSFRNGNSEIYVMNSDGSGQIRLTNHPAFDHAPTWSPDGSRIAFSSSRDVDDFRGAIYTMNSDGTDQVRITSTGAVDYYPAWSPDGTRIAFMSDRDNSLGIWTVAPDGSQGTQLTSALHPWGPAQPAWSPDGRKIAFVRKDPTTRRQAIYIMNADGSGATLVNSGFFSATGPSWSPDGAQIAFTAEGDPNTDTCGWLPCAPFIEIVGVDGKRYRSVLAASAEQVAWRPVRSGTP